MSKVWDNLVQQVENNPGIWEKPWFMDPKTKSALLPYNPSTKRNYSGFNIWMLELTRLSRGYSHNQWLTFNQCKTLGGFVNKGEHGTPIIVFSPPVFQTVKDETGEEKEILKRPGFFGSATVFNVEQTTITPEDLVKLPEKSYSLPEVEEMIARTGVKIIHSYSNRAYYSPALDQIHLPEEKQFRSQDQYYETKFHELIHWTGHKSRLNRLKDDAVFGSENYSREELVAEIGAVFLKIETGIGTETDNAAAYIKNWWSNIKEDKGSLIHAAGQAQKATGYILKGAPAKKQLSPETSQTPAATMAGA